MAFKLDDRFAWFLEQFGAPDKKQPVASDVFEKYSGKLPERLLEYWSEYGFCRFLDGLFWIVNPNDYEVTMQRWLSDTGILDEDTYYVIARDGFGRLYLWGRKNGPKYIIETQEGRVFDEGSDSERISTGKENESLQGFFAVIGLDDIELDDVVTDKPLFKCAVEKFGPLDESEVFSFEPALFIGGKQVLSSMSKVEIHVHHSILLDFLGSPSVMDIDGLKNEVFGA